MRNSLPRVLWVLIPIGLFAGGAALARDLTFEERVRAQEAIERVYYAHQLGATKPFEEAVPRGVLERKVRTYLKESLALEKLWNNPVTSEMLRAEVERIAARSRFPDRLQEIFHALHDDPFVLQECLARPILVDRLARSFFAFDERYHAGSRKEAEVLRQQLLSGELGIFSEHPGRTIVEARSVAGEKSARETRDERSPASDRRIDLNPEEFRQWRARAPRNVAEAGPVVEQREVFQLQVVLEQAGDHARVAVYTIPKTTWDDWWAAAERQFDERLVVAVASGPGGPLPAGERNQEQPLSEPIKAEALCPTDNTWLSGVLDDFPAGRGSHTAVWTGSLMLVWGGLLGGSTSLGTGSRYDPLSDTWTPVSLTNAPAARYGHTAIWTGSAMVVWGGSNGSNLNTGGRYDPTTDTWTPTSTASAPAARGGHAAVWTGSVMVVWGGGNGVTNLNSGGRYDPAADTWTPTSTTGAPAGRVSATAVWTGSRMVVWGGSADIYLNTGGRYDPVGDTWASTSTTNAPVARGSHTAVWTGSRMIVWGGAGPGAGNTGGRYDPVGDAWTPTSTTNAPAARANHDAVWTGSLMLVWGGSYGSYLNTGGRYDPTSDTWTPTSTTNAPMGRDYSAAVWTGSRMVVWGGSVYAGGFTVSVNTGGRYDPASDTWTPTYTEGPGGRFYHTAIWTGSLMVVWGGYGDGYFLLKTGGRYDPLSDTWTPTSTVNAPEARVNHSAVWTGSQMVVWGGTGSGFLDTGGRYDPMGDTWTSTATTNAAEARYYHTAVWTGSFMIVWGGDGGSGSLDTGGRYDPAGDTWAPTASLGAPEARDHHTAIWTGTRMVVWGGYGYTTDAPVSTGGRYDPASDAWTPTGGGAPGPRENHTAVWTGSRMIVWGGDDGVGYYNSGGRYDPAADTWTSTSTTNAPYARAGHTAIWTGSRMVVWGGGGDNTGGRYDPVNDTWTATAAANAPAGRDGHTAVWTGALMLVWGGDRPNIAYDNGGGYAVSEDLDGDGYGGTCDCDDTRASVYPGAPQTCGDGLNNDCTHPSWPALNGTNEFDDDGDGFTECLGDCDDTRASVYPGAPQICDGLNNNCSDPSWPALPADEADADGDAVRICAGDCDDTNGTVWGTPGEAVGLVLAGSTLTWSTPAPLGGTLTSILYDTMRSGIPSNFVAAAICVETDDGPNTTASDPATPVLGVTFYYLVRAQNACPGALGIGPLGTTSSGAARTARSCP